jgi:uncharacterized protein
MEELKNNNLLTNETKKTSSELIDKADGDSDNHMPPFVHCFKTDKSKYVFDANTMCIANVDDVTWEIISDVGVLDQEEIVVKYGDRFEADSIAEAYNRIIEQQQAGYFLSKRPKVEFPMSEEQIRQKLLTERQILTLNVTEQCNFRCRYCVYDGCHSNRPGHSPKQMDLSVAKRAIDDFLPHGDPEEGASISFYGGEPLLNFGLIKECVQYARKTAGDRKPRFSLTTNGSLLNGDIAEFLAVEDFAVRVSLDGPREIHDRYRRTADDQPTWDLVTRNAREYVRRYPERKLKLNFTAVLAPPLNLADFEDFCRTSDLIQKQTQLQVTFVDTKGLSDDTFHPRGIKGLKALYGKYMDNLCSGAINKNPMDTQYLLQRQLFEKDLLYFHKRFEMDPILEPLPEMYCSLGTCVPGTRRTFVGTDGGYWPCERLPQSEYLRIGDVVNGFDIPKIHRMLKEWIDMAKDQCGDCWCVRGCMTGCFSVINDGERPTRELRRAECEKFWPRKLNIITDYCKILESNKTNLDYMNDITIK